MRLIDADALKIDFDKTGLKQIEIHPNNVVDMQPTIDAAEVVRCKDCSNWLEGAAKKNGDLTMHLCDVLSGGWHPVYTLPDQYCCWGELKLSKRHLCNSCGYEFPECPAGVNDVEFGDGLGNDNICACTKYDQKIKEVKGE